ncbi:MAG: cation:proton antiporter [Chloroflexota bacterium]
MENANLLLIFAANFFIIAIASQKIGQFFTKLRLPLISGFLMAGIIVGPFGLNLITNEAIQSLLYIDQVSLAVIAFAAGSELHIQELRSRLKSITWVTIGSALGAPVIAIGVFFLADFIPFMQDMPTMSRVAVSLLAGTILIACSPSSTIAVVNELRAKGPFTQTVLGVTMVIDIVVIVMFAISKSIADVLTSGGGFDLFFIVLLAGEILLSIAIGYVLFKLLELILASAWHTYLKTALILAAGYGIFYGSTLVKNISHDLLPFDIHLESLLICMVASFMITNYSKHRQEFLQILHDVSPLIYVAFFTLTGAGLALDVLVSAWTITIVLLVIRVVALFVGTYLGGMAAGDPSQHNRLGWLTYVTQAGVGLGLAKEVVGGFPEWGAAFATMVISVIVVSQLIGPLLFKAAVNRVGEAHPRAEPHEFDGIRDAIIFGLEGQSLVLARQLQSHGWLVKLATLKETTTLPDDQSAADIDIIHVPDLSLESLHQLEAHKSEAFVALLSDDENYQIAEIAYEHFGIDTVVVRLNERVNIDKFHELGALIVDPDTAIVGMLDHFVRSPAAVSLMLGMEADQDVVEIEVRNIDLHNVAVRDLHLPLDVLVLSIGRHGHTLISQGYTRLRLGDWVTLVGSVDSLEQVMLRFEDQYDTDEEQLNALITASLKEQKEVSRLDRKLTQAASV